MIRKVIGTLSTKLSDGLSLSNSSLETLCLLVIGIASVRTVNLSHISGEMPTQAKVESTCRRLQRFFQYVDPGEDWSARLVVMIQPLPTGCVCLSCLLRSSAGAFKPCQHH